MQTPQRQPVNKHLRNLVTGEYSEMTPVQIPATPHLQRLGYGTGVEVMRMNRTPKAEGIEKSPWAIKRLNKNVINTDKQCYESRLLREAELLK